MRFVDIPQLTKMPHYHINVSWDYLKSWISGHPEIDLSPEYQREHVWTLDQQKRYVEYVLRGGSSGRDVYFNSPGWMSSDHRLSQKLELVDGKQRINAVLMFLDDIVPAFGTLCSEFEDKLRMTRPDFIIHVNNLKTPKEVMQWYIDMNAGGTMHTSEEIERVKQLIEKCEA